MVLVAARKTAKEMNELYGDNVWEKFFDLEEAAWDVKLGKRLAKLGGYPSLPI